MAQRYDAVIIGAGHNGLVCGAYLAKAGLKTLVLERRHVIGGAAVTEEVFDGFHFSVFSYVMSLMHPLVIRELELAKFGFEVLPASSLFCPLEDGDYIIFHDDVKKTQGEFARFSKKDADAYPAFDAHLQDCLKVVRPLLLETPVDPSKRDWKSLKATFGLLWRNRDAAGKMYRIADLLTMSAHDYLERWFESDIVKAVLAYYASIGTFGGPRSPGSAYVLLHHIMGEHAGAGGWGFMRGGMGAISDAIAESGQRFGLEIRTEAEVAEVKVKEGRATGIVLESGEEIDAKVIAANANAKILFLDLVGEKHLPPRPPGRYRPIPDLLNRLQDQLRLRGAGRGTGPSTRPRPGLNTRPTFTSVRPSTTSKGLSTMRNTAGTPPGHSSRPSCRASPTTPSRPRASTSSICLAATHPTA